LLQSIACGKVRRFGLTGGIARGAKNIFGQFAGLLNQWYIIPGCFEAWVERSSKGAVVFTFDDGLRMWTEEKSPPAMYGLSPAHRMISVGWFG